MRLGELLLQEHLITPEALEEALESQVVHGGRLGTNLVELGMLSEQELSRVLGQQHGVASASGEMVPDARALELVDLGDADEKDYLPMRVDATRMSVAVINPRDLETLDALAFRTGKRVVPVVIPEFRMNQLQRRYCKAFRAMGALDMNAVRPSRVKQAEAEKLTPTAKAEDLISEEEFQSLYAQALKGGSEEGDGELVLDLVEAGGEEPCVPGYVPGGLPEPVVAPPPVPPELHVPETLHLEEAPRPRTPAVVERLFTPLTFAEAQAELSRSSDREQVATTVLRFALGKWKRCLLLSVQGNLVTGWRGMGKGVREAAVKRIGIGLQAPSTFRLVRDTRSPYVGPVRRDAT